MFPIILVFILRESVDRSDNPTSRRNMNSRNGEFALKNWQTSCHFNLAHKLKKTETFKRKMKWEILRIKSVECKNDKIQKMTEVKTVNRNPIIYSCLTRTWTCHISYFQIQSKKCLVAQILHRARARRKSRIHGIHGSREFWRLPWFLAFAVNFCTGCTFVSKSVKIRLLNIKCWP